MPERDYKQSDTSGRNLETDELDRQLDAALAKYTAVEPRAGLEERVLATLRSTSTQSSSRAWWNWGVAATIAAVVIVAVALTWRSGKPVPPTEASHPSPTMQNLQKSGPRDVANEGGNELRPRDLRPPRRKTRSGSPSATVVAREPKLDQFPSPQPLSEQEKILVSYISEDLKHAVLLARAQAEALRQDQEEEKKWESNTGGTTDLQQRIR